MVTRQPGRVRVAGRLMRATMCAAIVLSAGAVWAAPAAPAVHASDAGTDPVTDCILPARGLEGPVDADRYIPSVGAVPAVMLFVDFADAPASGTPEGAWARLMPMADEWMRQSSYDRASLDVTPVMRWLRMPEPLSAYSLTASGSLETTAGRRYIEQAVGLADPDVDFSAYQAVYIVPAEEAQAMKRSLAWTLSPGSGTVADEVRVRHVVTFGVTLYSKGYGVMDHETSHFFGAPDLYASDSPSRRYVGIWDIMSDSGIANDHMAWTKWRLGWLDADQIDCVNQQGETDHSLVSLARDGGTKAVVLRTDLYSALVVEYRLAEGLDQDICSSGVLVYRVDGNAARLAGPIQVLDPTPGSATGTGMCEDDLADAALGVGASLLDPLTGISIQVTGTSDEGTAVDLHVSRPSTWTAPVRYARAIRTKTKANADGTVTMTATLSAAAKFKSCFAGRKVVRQEWFQGGWFTWETKPTSAKGIVKFTWTPDGGTYRLKAIDTWTAGWYCLSTMTQPFVLR